MQICIIDNIIYGCSKLAVFKKKKWKIQEATNVFALVLNLWYKSWRTERETDECVNLYTTIISIACHFEKPSFTLILTI